MEHPRSNLLDLSNEVEMRLTLEDTKAYEINLVVGVDDRPRCCNPAALPYSFARTVSMKLLPLPVPAGSGGVVDPLGIPAARRRGGGGGGEIPAGLRQAYAGRRRRERGAARAWGNDVLRPSPSLPLI